MSKDTKYEDGPVELPNGTVVGKVWRVQRKLGEGGCGAVYLVENSLTKKQAAMKAESNFVEGGAVLKVEVDILARLRGKKHVAELIQAGKKKKFQYMVMSLLGDSLNSLLRKCGKQCSQSTQIRVGIHVLHGLKQVHDSGFIHRDVKPANLAMGNRNGGTDPNVVHILDFGLSREFVVTDSDGGYKMRKPRKRALFRGTTRYCSMSTHEKNEQGRGDDLWSLLYVMVELRGPLPWCKIKEKKDLLEAKKAQKDSDLICNSPSVLIKFCDHLRTLDYWTRPDYLLLYKILLEAMDAEGYRFSDPWGWEEKSLAAKLKSEMKSAERMDDGLVKTQVDEIEEKKENPFTDEDFIKNPLGF